MRWFRLVLRVLGWLLTPLVAWAASFLGAWLGALASRHLGSANGALAGTALGGLLAGFGGILLWMRMLRRSPRLRHSLHVTREGIPTELLHAMPHGGSTPETEQSDSRETGQ